MEENFYEEFLRSDYNALQFLIYNIWQKKFDKTPERNSRQFTAEAKKLHEELVKDYGYKYRPNADDPFKNFRDQLTFLIKGKIDSIFTLENIQAFCHLYYNNKEFEGKENEDWVKYKKEHLERIDNYFSRKPSFADKSVTNNGSNIDFPGPGDENKALHHSITNFQSELKSNTEEILKVMTDLMVDVNGNINKGFQELEKSSKTISGSLSTRYVGNFPTNIDEMIKLIPTVKRSLIVVCDFPAYGQFSNPEGFGDYDLAFQNLLNRKRDRPEITLITYDLQRRFSDWPNHVGKSLEEFKQTDIYNRYFEMSGLEEPKVKSIDEFYTWLDDRHTHFQASLHEKGAKIFETGVALSTFLWIVDEKDAIFCFNNYGKENREVSFRTNDKKLIESLHVIAKGAIENSVRKTNFNGRGKSP